MGCSRWVLSLAACGAVLAAAPIESQEVTATRIERAAAEPENWLTYGGNYQAWRYSPLD